jgi:hypothetical protein
MKLIETVWVYLQFNLATDAEVANWTAYRGYLGDKMRVVRVQGGYIEVDPPKAVNTQIVPKDHFERVWKIWEDYKSQKVKRFELREKTWFSKYIISILHWYEINAT